MIEVGDRVVVTNCSLYKGIELEDIIKSHKVLSVSTVAITDDVELQNIELEGVFNSYVITNLDVRKV
jgi:hypothetical protein